MRDEKYKVNGEADLLVRKGAVSEHTLISLGDTVQSWPDEFNFLTSIYALSSSIKYNYAYLHVSRGVVFGHST